MGCCSSAPRSLAIETTVLRVQGDTCERCGDTVQAARSAAKDLQTALAPLNVRVTLVEHAATADQIRDAAFAALDAADTGGCC